MNILIIKDCSYCDTEHPEKQAVDFKVDTYASISTLLGNQMIDNEDAELYEDIGFGGAEGKLLGQDEEQEIPDIIIAPPVATAAEVASEETAVVTDLETPETSVEETVAKSGFETREELIAMGMDELRVIGHSLDVKDNNKEELADKIIAAREEDADDESEADNPFA